MTTPDPLLIRSDHVQIAILPLGATLAGVRFAGQSRNLVLGFANPADHATVPIYAGALVGPVANRIRGGKVVIDGKAHQMPLNEANRTTLHSGPDGLHAQVWKVDRHTASTLRLSCTLPDGANGLPGKRVFTAAYTADQTALHLTIEARTDRTTPINVAAHPYWNLDGRRDVSGHQLQIEADHYLPVDAHNLPTGQRAPVAGTLFDFQTPALVPMTPALDVNYCLADKLQARPRPAARLIGSDGTTLEIETTAPGLQVYNGAFIPRMDMSMSDAPALAPCAGIALEPQHWPDAPNHPVFPNIMLEPGAVYVQRTIYRLTAP